MIVGLKDLVVDPQNARKTFREIDRLASTIQESGLLQNLVVRTHPSEGKFFIIGGERRFRALKLLQSQQSSIPVNGESVLCDDDFPVECLVIDAKNTLVTNLIENTSREDLTPWDLGAAYNELEVSCGLSQTEIAQSVGKTQQHVSQRVLIYKGLHPDVLKKIKILHREAPSVTDLLIICRAVNELLQPDRGKQMELLTHHYTRANTKKLKKPGLNKQFSALKKMTVTPEVRTVVQSLVAFLSGEDRYFKYEETPSDGQN